MSNMLANFAGSKVAGEALNRRRLRRHSSSPSRPIGPGNEYAGIRAGPHFRLNHLAKGAV